MRPKRWYPGEFWAKHLVEWLNKNSGRASGRRIGELLKEMRRVTETLEPRWEQVADSKGGQMLMRRARDENPSNLNAELHEKINRSLSKYEMLPEVRFGTRVDAPNAWLVRWCTRETQHGSNTPVPQSEGGAVGLILQLAERGVVHRVSECSECGNWYFARFSHQKFCGGACQKKHFRDSEEWRAKRREYMREYRNTWHRKEHK
jgi:hypothetical protein